MQCSNSLEQIGLACVNYESTYKTLPPGCIAKGNDGNRTNVTTGWGIEILPFMEEQATYDLFHFSGNKSFVDQTANASGVSNVQAGQTRLASFVCPTDDHSVELVAPTGGNGLQWAPSTYRAVSGTTDRNRDSPNYFLYWDRSQQGDKKASRIIETYEARCPQPDQPMG